MYDLSLVFCMYGTIQVRLWSGASIVSSYPFDCNVPADCTGSVSRQKCWNITSKLARQAILTRYSSNWIVLSSCLALRTSWNDGTPNWNASVSVQNFELIFISAGILHTIRRLWMGLVLWRDGVVFTIWRSRCKLERPFDIPSELDWLTRFEPKFKHCPASCFRKRNT